MSKEIAFIIGSKKIGITLKHSPKWGYYVSDYRNKFNNRAKITRFDGDLNRAINLLVYLAEKYNITF